MAQPVTDSPRAQDRTTAQPDTVSPSRAFILWGSEFEFIEWVLHAASATARPAARAAARDAAIVGLLILGHFAKLRLPEGYALKAAKHACRKAHRDAKAAALKEFLRIFSRAKSYIRTSSGLKHTEQERVNRALTSIADGASTDLDLDCVAGSEAYEVLHEQFTLLLQVQLP